MPPESTDPKVNQILERVRRQEIAMSALFERMDEDWMLYNLQPFRPRQGDGIRPEEAYTSNRPQVVANKLVGAIASAKRIINTDIDADNEEQRDTDQNFERFGIGALKIADFNRESVGRIPVITSLGFRAVTRGGYVACRALLTKGDNGETEVDVTPIDPRHLLVQFGKREPLWAATVTSRDRASIKDEYPNFTFDDEQDGEEQHVHRVVDYYWKEDGKYMNGVIVDAKWAKKPTNTFATKFPVIIRAVGANDGESGVTSLSEDSTTTNQVPGIRDFGESAFSAIRNINDFHNLLNSFRMAMARKSVRQVNKVFSADGSKELDADIDENTSELNLSTDNEEDVVPMEVRELTRDIDSLHGSVAAEYEDGTLPGQSFGRIPGPLSGAALSILGQAEGQTLTPFIRPIESCIEGVIEALASQFETGRYNPIKVSGKTRDRRGFSREITPEDIEGHDLISVRLVPVLPRDRQEQMLMAQIAATPGANGIPLLSHYLIWDEILELQDADLENERIHAQLARTSSEKMALMTQLIAAQKAGELESAEFLRKEINRIEDNEAMQTLAQKVAFLTMMFQNPLQASVAGMQEQQGGGEAIGTPRNPLSGISPILAGLTGLANNQGAGPTDQGVNTTGPRVSEEQRANSIGITLATPQQTQQFG